MRRLLAAALVAAAALPLTLVGAALATSGGGAVAAPASGAVPDPAQAQDPAVAALLTAGAEAYALRCAVCHGSTGGGIEEARLAFPPDERRCTRCHRPSNPVVQPLDQPFADNDMFSIGEPPPLHATAERPGGMAAAAAPEALFAYVKATMPRYDPGRLGDDAYWALTAHLLALNGRSAELPRVVELAGRE